MLQGIAASAGIGIGRVMQIQEQTLAFTPRTVEDTNAEQERFRSAVEVFCEKTEAMAVRVKEQVGEKEAEILRGHILMIRDPYMTAEIEKSISEGNCAEQALSAVCDMFIAVFSSADDELTNQRATDVEDIKSGVLAVLLGVEEADITAAPAGTVLVARDLTPSMAAGIRKENIAGIVTEAGGKTSHSAILARAMEIPAVLSVPDAMAALADGTSVIVDGLEGVVLPHPEMEQVAMYTRRREAFLKERRALGKYIGKSTVTADRRVVELLCNIGSPEEAEKVFQADGEGVGLFRTEFLFMDRTALPTEEEQFEAYKKAALILKGRPLIIRTLDVGGDKEIPYLGLPKEDNPFLGLRAVRFCLQREDIYRPQLRALLRAAAYGDVRIMVPMVSCVDELRKVKAWLRELSEELEREGVPFGRDVRVGVMIETPAAALIADMLAKEADFFSIGTNDLTQYVMAVDRGNAKVSYLYSAASPAVLRAVRRVIDCGHEAGIPVGMCGEAAADPALIPLWLAFGLDEFSVSSSEVLSTRRQISLWTREEARGLWEEVSALTAEADITARLREAAKQKSGA